MKFAIRDVLSKIYKYEFQDNQTRTRTRDSVSKETK